jgi:hypothetical protein
MTDPARASGNVPASNANRTGPSSAPSSSASADAIRAEAKQTIDASRQRGVVNPGELSKDVARAYAGDPRHGAALHAAVSEQLSARDRASLDDHLAPTVGAVAGAQGVEATTRRSFDTPDAAARDALNRANPRSVADNLEYGGLVVKDLQTGRYSATAPRVGTGDSFDPYSVRTPGRTQQAGDYHTHGDYSVQGPGGQPQRTGNPALDDYNSDRFSRGDTDGIRADGRNRPGYKGYLGTPSGDYRSFDPASGSDVVMGRQPGTLATTARTAGRGAVVGAATDAALTAAGALCDGHLSGSEAQDVLTSTARGAAVGGTYAVTEHGLVRMADRATGVAVERGAASAAARIGAADAGAVGAASRTVATRLGGAGVAGAAISAGVSIYENRDGLARGDSQAIGNVAGDVVVGTSAALGGAAAGAAIGSVVPGVGTAVGAVVGLGVGFAADYVMRAGGVDQAVGQAVAGGVDAVKGLASKAAGWLGW